MGCPCWLSWAGPLMGSVDPTAAKPGSLLAGNPLQHWPPCMYHPTATATGDGTGDMPGCQAGWLLASPSSIPAPVQAGSVIWHTEVFVHSKRTKDHLSVPPTIRAVPISTCPPNHSRLRANPAWSPSQPCHEHLGRLLLYYPGKQHLAYAHLPSLSTGSRLLHTRVHSAMPPAAPYTAAPSQGAH